MPSPYVIAESFSERSSTGGRTPSALLPPVLGVILTIEHSASPSPRCRHDELSAGVRTGSGPLLSFAGVLSFPKQGAARMSSPQLDLRFFKAVVDHMSDAVLWRTADGQVVYANDAACAMLGYRSDELLSLNVSDLAPDGTEAMWRAR